MQTPQIETVQVLPQNVPLAFEFAARAQGSKETEVRARVGGILLKRNYVEGTEVKEGSVLFQIDPEPYKVALKQAQAKLAQTQAELKNAETQLARTEKLFKQGYASEKTRDEAVAKADSLKASLQLAEAEVDAAQLNLDYTTVTAPISGKTSMEAQSEGSLISTSGNAGLLTSITQLDPIYVDVRQTSSDMLRLKHEIASGKIKAKDGAVEVTVLMEDGSVYPLKGTLTFTGEEVDEGTGMVNLRAVVPNPNGDLLPGMFVRTRLEEGARPNSIVLSQRCVMRDPKGQAYVWVVTPENTIEQRNVVADRVVGTNWLIESGLKAGERVVLDGIGKVRAGAAVKIAQPAAAEQASAK